MRRNRLRPAYKVFLGYALFCAALLCGQAVAYWRLFVVRERRIDGVVAAFDEYTNTLSMAVEGWATSRVDGVVVDGDGLPCSRPRLLGVAYSRGPRYVYPYADIELDGCVSRRYFEAMPIAVTSAWPVIKRTIVEGFSP